MTALDTAATARRYFAAFQSADRDAMEALLAPGFAFTSPFDDHIDRAAWFERCWPFAGSFRFGAAMRVHGGEDEVVVLYETEDKPGGTFRNAECFRFDADGRIRSIDVYFGFLPPAMIAAMRAAAG